MSASTPPALSVVILSWNTCALLRACLQALERDPDAAQHELIVVDNGSSDGSPGMVAREFPAVRLLANAENRLYAQANNQGARSARGRLLCLLNSDTEVRPGALRQLARFLDEHAGHAAVAPRLVNPDGSLQHACRRLPTLLEPLLESTSLGRIPPGTWLSWWARMGDFDHRASRDVAQPPGACLMLRTSEYLELGGLDEELSLFFNDVDLCLALRRQGRRVHYLAEAEVLHHQGGSTRAHGARSRNLLWIRNRASYYRKNHGRLAARWLGVVLALWGLEVRLRILLGRRSAVERHSARVALRSFLRECRAV